MSQQNYDLVFKLDTISNLFSPEGVPFTVNGISEELKNQIEVMLGGEGNEENTVLGVTHDQIRRMHELLFSKYDSLVRVSVLGLFNRGKTFLLNELCGVDHDSSFKVHTEGISISVPKNGQIMIIDSAGTNVPLTKDFLDYEKLHFGEFKAETPDPDTFEFSEREEAVKRREIEVANYHSELTHFSIVRKKNSEVYIQKCLFQLSNVIIIVVNEMTWADQQYISSIVANIKKSKSNYGEIKLFVVHNYKSAESEDDFNKLRKMYVTDVYHGYEKTTPQGANIFVESRNNIQHVFLCKNHSEVGRLINRKSLDFILLNIVSGNFATAIRNNFLHEFLKINEDRISEIVRNDGNKVQLCWNKRLKNFSIRAPIKDPNYILPSIDITPDSTIVLKSSDFLLEVDQIVDDTSLILTMDLPGYSESDINIKDPKSSLKIHIDERNYLVTISGERKLKFRKLHPDLGRFTSVVAYTDRKYTNVSIERTYGFFHREFIINRKYNLKAVKRHFENGELTLIFPLGETKNIIVDI